MKSNFFTGGWVLCYSVHVFNWFGITYWDQTNVMWFLHLAILSSLTSYVIDNQGATDIAQVGLSEATKKLNSTVPCSHGYKAL